MTLHAPARLTSPPPAARAASASSAGDTGRASNQPRTCAVGPASGPRGGDAAVQSPIQNQRTFVQRKPLILSEKRDKQLPARQPRGFVKGRFPRTFCSRPGERAVRPPVRPSGLGAQSFRRLFRLFHFRLSLPSARPAASFEFRPRRPLWPGCACAGARATRAAEPAAWLLVGRWCLQNQPGAELRTPHCGGAEPPPQPHEAGTTVLTRRWQRRRLRSRGPGPGTRRRGATCSLRVHGHGAS